jgi:hypothetical protein
VSNFCWFDVLQPKTTKSTKLVILLKALKELTPWVNSNIHQEKGVERV